MFPLFASIWLFAHGHVSLGIFFEHDPRHPISFNLGTHRRFALEERASSGKPCDSYWRERRARKNRGRSGDRKLEERVDQPLPAGGAAAGCTSQDWDRAKHEIHTELYLKHATQKHDGREHRKSLFAFSKLSVQPALFCCFSWPRDERAHSRSSHCLQAAQPERTSVPLTAFPP